MSEVPHLSETGAITLWLPEPDLYVHQALGKLLEEAGEVSQIAARCLIQGLEQSDPKTGTPNRDALAKELADLETAIRFVRVITVLDPMTDRAERKFEGFSRWTDMLVEYQEADSDVQ